MKNYPIFKDGFFLDPLFFLEKKINKFEFNFNFNFFQNDNIIYLYSFEGLELIKINEYSIFIKYKNLSFFLDPFFYENKNYKNFKTDYFIFSGDKNLDLEFIKFNKEKAFFHIPLLNKDKLKNINCIDIKEYTWWQSSILKDKNKFIKLTCLPKKNDLKSKNLWSNWILELDNFKILILSKNESQIYVNQIEKRFNFINIFIKI